MNNVSKVQKGLSQEEMTLVNNISSLISELKSSSGVSAGMEGREGQPPIEQPSQISHKDEQPSPSDKADKEVKPSPSDKAEKEDEEPSIKKGEKPSPSPSDSVKKDQIKSDSDSTNANDTDDVEARMMDTLSEVNEDNVDEVKKAVRLLKELKEIRTMKSRSISPLASAMVELTKVVKGMQNEQSETQMALKNILEGLGVTKQMSIVQKSESASRPVMDADNEAMAKVIKGLLTEVVKSSIPQADNVIGKNTSIALGNVEKALHSLGAMIPTYNKVGNDK